MEDARYWMWAKRKPDSNPHHNNILAPTTTSSAMNSSSYSESSWEEQAFAEDAAGALIGGCVWPPRSYSCSFCRREFRSAQALGGHMNVHRRDRARLKQSPMNIIPSPTTDIINNYPRTVITTSFDAAAPPPYNNSFSYNNNNPNPDFAIARAAVRVSSSAKDAANGEGKIVTSSNDGPCLIFSSLVGENDKEKRVSSLIIPPSWSSFVAEKRGRVWDSIEKKSTAGVEQEESRAEKLEDCVTDDLSTSLNLVVRQTNITSSDEEVASFKRRRVEITKQPSVSFFTELGAADRSEVFKTGSGSVEEVDLELRLGNI